MITSDADPEHLHVVAPDRWWRLRDSAMLIDAPNPK